MKNILVVEDDGDIRELICHHLKKEGFQVLSAFDAEAGYAEVQKRLPDAIILDLFMPEMDGIETLKHLLSKNPDLQIIFLTGHATLEKGIEAVKLGAREFMEKPVDMDKLIDKVNAAKTKNDILSEKKAKRDIDDLLKKKGW